MQGVADEARSPSALALGSSRYGYWLQYLYLYELSGKKYRGKITLAEGDNVKDDIEAFVYNGEWNSVIPQDSVEWINNYVPKLAGVFEQNVLEATQKVIQNSLVEGLTLQERMKALREAAPELSAMSKHRIEAIARTEITRADTLGRLTSMKANDDVIGVEFSAIMDDRTTDICASRHGLVMRLARRVVLNKPAEDSIAQTNLLSSYLCMNQ